MQQQSVELNESVLYSNISQGAEYAFSKWRSLVESFERNSVLAKTRGVEPQDIAALGAMLQQWENYEKFCEANGTLSDLGILPKHALEIITADFGTSIVPHIASVQPIKERMGIVYYKTVRATKARGNVASGDYFQHPFAPPNRDGAPGRITTAPSGRQSAVSSTNTESGNASSASNSTTTAPVDRRAAT